MDNVWGSVDPRFRAGWPEILEFRALGASVKFPEVSRDFSGIFLGTLEKTLETATASRWTFRTYFFSFFCLGEGEWESEAPGRVGWGAVSCVKSQEGGLNTEKICCRINFAFRSRYRYRQTLYWNLFLLQMQPQLFFAAQSGPHSR